MWFEAVKVRRSGVMVPRWQLASLTRYEGFLRVEEKRVKVLERHSVVAQIIESARDPKDWQTLYDARLLSTTSQWMTLTGFEIEHSDAGAEVHYMQTWLLTPKPAPSPT